MSEIESLERIFIVCAFLFQIILIIHFALRKAHFDFAIRHGKVIYGLCIPAVGFSVYFLLVGMAWPFWVAGFVYFTWAIFGYFVEYILNIQWLEPAYWPVFVPYVVLYLATLMFYWWPLALIYKPLWYLYGALFLISTYLNATSHHNKEWHSKKEVMI